VSHRIRNDSRGEKALYDAAGALPEASIDFASPTSTLLRACGLARINQHDHGKLIEQRVRIFTPRNRREFGKSLRPPEMAAQPSPADCAGGTDCSPSLDGMIDPEERGPRNFTLVALGDSGGSGCFPTLTSICCFFTPTVKPSRLSKIGFESFRRGCGSAPEVSPATRTLQECDRFDPANVEFAISLLDCRYLAGDADLFARLHDKLFQS